MSKGPSLEPAATVASTVLDLGSGRLTSYRLGDLTIIALSGAYSQRLMAEFEQQAGRASSSVGIDLSGLAGVVPAVLPAVERVRRRLLKHGHALVLIKATPRFLDLLELQGLAGNYCAEAPRGGEAKGEEEAAVQLKSFSIALRQNAEIERGFDGAAHRIFSFMPRSLPDIAGWQFAAYLRPCDRIGGDFYDFIPLSEGRIGIAIGDVSGHGLPGAVVMGMAKKVLQLRAQDMGSARPGDVLSQVNTDLACELGGGTFVTMLYGVLEPDKGDFAFARAGHEPPVFLPAPGALPELVVTQGLGIGMAQTSVFRRLIENCRMHLEPGEGVLLTSDGVTDASDGRGVRFGRERLKYAVSGESAGGAIRALLAALSRFAGEAPRGDDVTAVAFGRAGPI